MHVLAYLGAETPACGNGEHDPYRAKWLCMDTLVGSQGLVLHAKACEPKRNTVQVRVPRRYVLYQDLLTYTDICFKGVAL